jgi:hypothetical protein
MGYEGYYRKLSELTFLSIYKVSDSPSDLRKRFVLARPPLPQRFQVIVPVFGKQIDAV